ncbi:MAG: preprotein translocase subunit YajC [Oscillibacter sp.]|nr:preprotein translocase subunit YajC [Oscillibacter sp.]
MGSLLIPLVVMIALMYFLMIRPENKRKKQADEMRSNLKKGDQITTIGGIVGKIVQVTDENIIIETSDDRVRMELTKWAVSTNNSNPPEDKKSKKAKKAEEEPAKIEEGSPKD